MEWTPGLYGRCQPYLPEANKAFRLYVYPLSIDPDDPARAISSPADYCQEFDKIVGKVIDKLPANIPFIVLSDHGFAPLKRKVNLAVLMTNFKMPNQRVPMIWDLAPTILNILGVSTPADMRGKSII